MLTVRPRIINGRKMSFYIIKLYLCVTIMNEILD